MIKLDSEDEVLSIEWRKAYIECIESPSNKKRKKAALKRFEVYRDQTKKWVMDGMKKSSLKDSTIKQMEASVSNISIVKKIVNKLAKVYQNGAIREVKADQEKIDLLIKELDFNSAMSKCNRYLELSKNDLVYVLPVKNVNESLAANKKIYDLGIKVLNDHAYDPIIDYDNDEIARGFVLSEFTAEEDKVYKQYTGERPRNFVDPIQETIDLYGNESKEYIFWTNFYHFTCNHKGEILKSKSPENNLNPIGILPQVDFSYDKDSCFWAEGGDDLVDGGIAINLDITNLTSIMNIQGYGQFVIIGEDIPSVLEFGPHNALVFKTNPGQEKPTAEILSATPPINEWMGVVEQKTALLLSTNNLSARNVSTKLSTGDAPSGIALLIENSEVTYDIEDKQKIFKDKEPLIWERVRRWMDVLLKSGELSKTFSDIGVFNDSDIQLSFPKVNAVVTESEKLDNLAKRKELGLNTDAELIVMDVGCTEEEAEEKLKEISEEKQEKMKPIASDEQWDSFKPMMEENKDNGKIIQES